MVQAVGYIEDINGQTARALDDAYTKEIQQRRKAYRRSWDYYYGNHKQHLTDDGTNTDDNVTINLIELLFDKGVSALMGTTSQGAIKGPDFDIVGDDPSETPSLPQRLIRKVRQATQPQQESKEQQYLDRVWEANSKALLLHDLALNGSACGHVFIKLVPDGLPDPDNSDAMLPRLIVLNPANVTVFWDAGDLNRVLWYRIQYKAGEQETRQDIVRMTGEDGADLGTWRIRDLTRPNDTSEWKETRETLWPHAWPPIVDWKNLPRPNEYYGLNDLRQNGNLNDGLNFTASNTQRIIKLHANPKTIMTGAKANDLTDTAIDSLWAIQSAEARVYNLEMQSDLSSSLNYMQLIRRAFFDSGRELDPATVQDKLGALTNFGLRVLNRDNLGKTGTKRLLYGAGLRCLCRYILELGEFGPNRKVVDKWPDPLPNDELVTAQALQIDRANGLSQSTYLERRGYDAEAEAQKREMEIGEQVLSGTLSRQGTLLDRLRNGRVNDQQSTGQQQPGNGNGAMAALDGRGNQRNGGY